MFLKGEIVKASLFGVVFIGLCILVGMGKLPTEYLKYLLFLLAPSPVQPGENTEKKQP